MARLDPLNAVQLAAVGPGILNHGVLGFGGGGSVVLAHEVCARHKLPGGVGADPGEEGGVRVRP